MDLNFDKPFIIKAKKIKDLISFINNTIEENLKKSIFYEEDKQYFYFPNVKLKFDSIARIKSLDFRTLKFYMPKLIILKGKKINNFYLNKDEWLIITYDIRESYYSENKIYVFTLS
jgi:hypothetical protein